MNNEPSRRCTDADVDPTWWLEPDIDPSDFGETTGHSRSLDTEYGRALQVARQDQVRAKVLCYQCPFIAQCRNESWDEPAHIWGGLDANERYAARQTGQVPIGSQYVYKSARKSLATRSKVVGMFMAGRGVDELAATLGCNSEQVWYHVKGALATVRAAREDSLWKQATPPAMPEGTARSSFRLGSLVRTETLLPGVGSSSGSDTRTQTAA